jgi:dTMP kinase
MQSERCEPGHGPVGNDREGLLIAFCGLDGSGKTTQIELLFSRLQRYTSVEKVQQPSKWFRTDSLVRSYLNQEIAVTQAILAELALFSTTDRLRHGREVIEPLLRQGRTVISDRHVLCGYASLVAGGFDEIEWMKELNKSVRLPDIAFYLDIEPAAALQRIIRRDGVVAKRQEQDLQFLTRFRDAYRQQPWGRDYLPNYHTISAGGREETTIAQEIWDVTETFMRNRTEAMVR